MPAYLVAGLGFGDEGKGSIVQCLTELVGSNLIVRYNGGPQAAHNVVMFDGRHHCFRQLGSGMMFHPTVKTYLSKFMLVSPPAMIVEAEELKKVGVYDALDSVFVDERCVVITPFHIAANRLLELSRGDKRHGSTGFGIGQARKEQIQYGTQVLTVADILDPKLLREKLEFHRELAWKEIWKDTRSRSQGIPSILEKDPIMSREFAVLLQDNVIDWFFKECRYWASKVYIVSGAQDIPLDHIYDPIFEGAQGVLLDETHGFQPYTTWTDITFENTTSILREMKYCGEIHKTGVLRSYHTRHGAGPFPSEKTDFLDKSVEKHNATTEYSGAFRIGPLDLSLVSKAKEIIGHLDCVVINHMDLFVTDSFPEGSVPITHSGNTFSVEEATNNLRKIGLCELINEIKDCTSSKKIVLGFGPTSANKSFSSRDI